MKVAKLRISKLLALVLTLAAVLFWIQSVDRPSVLRWNGVWNFANYAFGRAPSDRQVFELARAKNSWLLVSRREVWRTGAPLYLDPDANRGFSIVSINFQSEAVSPFWFYLAPPHNFAASGRIGGLSGFASTESLWQRLGFAFYPGSLITYAGAGPGHFILKVPQWFTTSFPALCLSVSVVFRRLWCRVRQPKPGFCPTYGYDLRATPDRCPECGHATDLPFPPSLDTVPSPKNSTG
jgi:hypothetical protein